MSTLFTQTVCLDSKGKHGIQSTQDQNVDDIDNIVVDDDDGDGNEIIMMTMYVLGPIFGILRIFLRIL